ncbi:armadillo-type protein [Parasitella parasitica]|nr:armadillo-type protein [Parasitella parasitica]
MSISVETLKSALNSVKNDPAIAVHPIVDAVNTLNLLNEDNSNWEKGTLACKGLADALRTDSLRSPLGDAGIIENLAKSLNEASGKQLNFQIQALRVLGNLCFDNENNRKRVKDAGIVPIVARYLTETPRLDLTRTVCGFYLNSSMDYAPIQIEIAESGAAKSLVNLIKPEKVDDEALIIPEEDISIIMAAKVLDNIVAEESARKIIATPYTIKAYIARIKHYSHQYTDNLDMLENLTDTLLQLIIDDDDLQNVIIDCGELDFLLEFLEDTEFELDDKQDKDKLKKIRENMNKITIFAASTDSKMEELYKNDRILSKLLAMAKSKSEVVHQCAIYVLGNLARTDQHCIELVENYNLSKLLLDLYQTTDNAMSQYVILGCLKHLCLPPSNKVIIGNGNCLEILSPTIDETKDMLKRNQFLTIGIIKLLCASNYENSKRIIQENNTLSRVTRFLKRVDDVGAKSEATRILTNLVKSVWKQKDSNDLRMQVMEAHVLEPIIELVRTSKFDVLKNDGILALILILSESSDVTITRNALLLFIADPPLPIIASEPDEEGGEQKEDESRSFVQVLVDSVCTKDNDMPVQIKCNACTLLCKMVELARKDSNSEVVEAVKSITSNRLEGIHDNSELYTVATTLSKALQQ